MAPIFALIVTGEKTAVEFGIWAQSVQAWHPDAEAYVFTDSATAPRLAALKSKLTIHLRNTLDKYTGLNRSDMEARGSSKFNSLWTEFMYEKAEVLKWAFASSSTTGVWFNDADIVHTAPLPAIADGATVALSPHSIRAGDEARYGKYNGGYFWIHDPALLDVWIAAAPKSRFYEQAALEEVAAAAGSALYEFPPHVNFGWWRMYQGSDTPAAIQARFGIYRGAAGIGIRYMDAPLQSIHTHLDDKTTSANGTFNRWFDGLTAKFASHPPLRAFRKMAGF